MLISAGTFGGLFDADRPARQRPPAPWCARTLGRCRAAQPTRRPRLEAQPCRGRCQGTGLHARRSQHASQRHAARRVEARTQVGELGVGRGKVRHECSRVRGVPLEGAAEGRIRGERRVCGEPEELRVRAGRAGAPGPAARVVGVVRRVCGEPEELRVRAGRAGAPGPAARVVGVVEGEPPLRPGSPPRHAHAVRAVRPRAVSARPGVPSPRLPAIALSHRPRPLLEGPAEGVRPAEGHDLRVAEAHAAEHPPEVRRRVGRAVIEGRRGPREAALGRALRFRLHVHPAIAHGGRGPARGGESRGARELDEVRPGQDRVLLLEGFQIENRLLEARVGPVR
mmetsp:Transcript_11334/g.38628  ORF Transcript_11334/g.38628 Transcript_11334/m.38628 type:complete len:339 (+) Transcript_11334:62-1078(+)